MLCNSVVESSSQCQRQYSNLKICTSGIVISESAGNFLRSIEGFPYIYIFMHLIRIVKLQKNSKHIFVSFIYTGPFMSND
jgi:hypothetical protein